MQRLFLTLLLAVSLMASSLAAGSAYAMAIEPVRSQPDALNVVEQPHSAAKFMASNPSIVLDEYSKRVPPPPPFTSSTAAKVDIDIEHAPVGAKPQYRFNENGGGFGGWIDCGPDTAWKNCGNKDIELNFANLPDGVMVIEVRLVNGDGTAIPNAIGDSFTWTIDTLDPDTTIDSKPPDFTNAISVFTFSMNDPAPSSGLKQFECRLNDSGNNGWSPCTSPKSYAPSSLNEGDNTFEVRATDYAGNFDIIPASHSWTFDKTPPTVLASNPITTSTLAEVTFNITATDTLSGIDRIECKVDSVEFTLCESPFTQTVTDGTHNFQFRAYDKAGNMAISQQYNVQVDTQVPTVSPIVANVGASGTITNGTSVIFTLSGYDGPPNNPKSVNKFRCSLTLEGQPEDWKNCDSTTKTYSLLTQGTYVFKAKARDNANNESANVETFSWTIDLTRPTLEIISPNQQVVYTNSPTATFIFTAIDTYPAASSLIIECRVGIGLFTNCDTPSSAVPNARQVTFNLSQTQQVFEIRARDQATNTRSLTRTVIADFSEPNTTLLGVQSNPTNNRNPVFTFVGNDNNTFTSVANLRYECSLNALPWKICTSNSIQYSNLSDGEYTFQVRAVDQAGNFDTTPSTFRWRIDIFGPDTAIQTKPLSYTASTTATFTFSGADAITGTGVIAYECQIDGSAWTSCTSPRSYTGLVNGLRTFGVRALDRAGNADATPATFTWTIDTIVPPMPSITYPTTTTLLKQLAFAFNGDDNAGGSGRERYQCSLTTGTQTDTWTTCSSVYKPSGRSDGVYTFKVRVVDKVGNVGPAASKTITLDQTAPQATFVYTSPALATQQITATFVFTATNLRQGETITFTCALNGENSQTCDSPFPLINLGDKSYVFTVFATDNAGNIGATAAYTWTVDTVAPDAVFMPLVPPRYRNEQRPTILFRPVDDAGTPVVSFQCILTGPISGSPLTITPCGTNTMTTTWSYTPDVDLPEGDYTLAIIPIDAAGNKDTNSPTSYDWTIERQAPDTVLLSRSPADTLTAASIFTFTFALSGSELLTPTFECWLDSGDWSPCSSPFIPAALDTGSHTFMVRAKDAAGNVDETPPSTTWTVDRTGPEVTITNNPAQDSNSSSATFDFSAADNVGGSGLDTIRCRIDGEEWTTCDAGTVTYTNLEEGAYTFHVQAFDQLGNAGAALTFIWTVDLTAPDTTFTGSLPDRINVQRITLSFTGTDTLSAERMKFECSLDDAPFTDCVSPRTFQGLSNGPHNLRVRAVDGAGNVDQSPAIHRWIVDVPNPNQEVYLPLVKR